MQVFKTSDTRFSQYNADLKEAKSLKSKGEKLDKAAKSNIKAWLKSERSWDVDAQPIGAIAIIKLDEKDCIKVERKGRNAIDVTRLQTEEPDIAAKFSEEKPATYIDAL